jgi:hypothetical protein
MVPETIGAGSVTTGMRAPPVDRAPVAQAAISGSSATMHAPFRSLAVIIPILVGIVMPRGHFRFG